MINRLGLVMITEMKHAVLKCNTSLNNDWLCSS